MRDKADEQMTRQNWSCQYETGNVEKKKNDQERDKGNGLKVGCFKSRRSKERHRAWIVVAAEEVFGIMYARCQLQRSDGSSLSRELTICVSESKTLVIAWLTINIMR